MRQANLVPTNVVLQLLFYVGAAGVILGLLTADLALAIANLAGTVIVLVTNLSLQRAETDMARRIVWALFILTAITAIAIAGATQFA